MKPGWMFEWKLTLSAQLFDAFQSIIKDGYQVIHRGTTANSKQVIFGLSLLPSHNV